MREANGEAAGVAAEGAVVVGLERNRNETERSPTGGKKRARREPVRRADSESLEATETSGPAGLDAIQVERGAGGGG